MRDPHIWDPLLCATRRSLLAADELRRGMNSRVFIDFEVDLRQSHHTSALQMLNSDFNPPDLNLTIGRILTLSSCSKENLPENGRGKIKTRIVQINCGLSNSLGIILAGGDGADFFGPLLVPRHYQVF